MNGAAPRIIQYLNFKGISKYKFYKKTSLSNGFLDRNRNIGSDKCEIISEQFPDLNIEWVVTGKGEMLKGVNRKIHEKTELPPVAQPARTITDGIPLIPCEAMAGIFAGDVSVTEIECDRYIVPVFNNADFLITVKGSSMVPKYYGGDIVACKILPMNDIFFQWNKIYVLDTIQGPLLKRITRNSDKVETVILVSENNEFEPFELPISQIRAVSIVLGAIHME